MEEGTSKAIPLRRSRNGARVVTTRPLRLTERLTAGAQRALEPPRQAWLAGLGGLAVTVRGARTAWSHLVSEGTVVESWLRRALGGAPEDRA
jgi:hypothetical protein